MMENTTLLRLYLCGRHETLFSSREEMNFAMASKKVNEVIKRSS